MFYFAVQLVGVSLMFDYDSVGASREELTSLLNGSVNNASLTMKKVEEENEINSLGIRYQLAHEGMTLREALKNKTFYMILVMMTLAMVGPRTVVTNYKIFGQTFITSDLYLSQVGSISNVFNALGRLFWGLMVNKYSFKTCFIAILTFVIAFVSTFYITKLMLIKELYLLGICGLFFSQCGIFVCMPTVLVKTFGPKNFTAIYGFMLLSSALSSVTLAIIGSFKDDFGWFGLFIIGTSLTFIAWIMAFFFNVKKRNGDDI